MQKIMSDQKPGIPVPANVVNKPGAGSAIAYTSRFLEELGTREEEAARHQPGLRTGGVHA